MFDMYGRHIPDYPGQQYWQDPAYIRNLHQQAANMQTNAFQNGTSSQPVQQPAPQVAQPPVQSSAPISVRGEQQALDWPIAPGNSLTFIDESAGYVYTKTSLNQFDRPQFVKYKLVREDVQQPADAPQSAANAPAVPMPAYALRTDVDALRNEVMGELEDFRARLDELDGVKSNLAAAQRENVALQNQLNMAAFRADNTAQTAALIADNTAQTQYIVNRVAPYPIPAYPVGNPYGYYGFGFNNGFGGCGCNGNGFGSI